MKISAPMLLPFAALTIGILSAGAGVPMWIGLIAAILGAACYFAAIKLTGNPLDSYRFNFLHWIWVALVFVGIGIFDYSIQRPFTFDEEKTEIVHITGVVIETSSPVSGDKSIIRVSRFVTKEGENVRPQNCRLLVQSDYLECTVGDIVGITANVAEIKDNDNYFDQSYSSRMKNRGLTYQSRITHEQMTLLGHENSYLSLANSIRNDIEAFIEKCKISRDTQNFLITVLLGDRSFLNADTRELFSDLGISHILALSGMHVAIISAILAWLLFPLNFIGYYRYRMIITCVLLFIYAFITGCNPSTVRATFMLAVLTVCLILERKNSAWNSLLTATFIILLISPASLFDTGLQLSFICVASLIFFVNGINPIDHRRHHILYTIAQFLLTSIVASAATWCISAYYLGKVSLLFLPANILILPLLPIYLTVTIIYFAFAACGLDFSWLATVVDSFQLTMMPALEWLQSDGNHAIEFSPGISDVVLWLALVALCAIWLNGKRTKIIGWSCAGVLSLFIVSVSFNLNAAEDDFIIQRQLHDIKILKHDKTHKETTIRISRDAVSELEVVNQKILVLDADIKRKNDKDQSSELTANLDSATLSVTHNIETNRSNKAYDIILMSNGCHNSIAELDSIYGKGVIVILSNVRQKREEKLIQEADSLGHRVHSIRRDGPFRFTQYRNSSQQK